MNKRFLLNSNVVSLFSTPLRDFMCLAEAALEQATNKIT
jgi:hypothetical protein